MAFLFPNTVLLARTRCLEFNGISPFHILRIAALSRATRKYLPYMPRYVIPDGLGSFNQHHQGLGKGPLLLSVASQGGTPRCLGKVSLNQTSILFWMWCHLPVIGKASFNQHRFRGLGDG